MSGLPSDDPTELLRAPPDLQASPRLPVLQVLTGAAAGRAFRLTKPVTSLGRAAECDIVLPDQGVSRHHADLALEGSAVRFEDRGSTNGSYLDGLPVSSRTLQEGDRVCVGPRVIVKFTRMDSLEVQQLESTKLRAVGQLAAGMAHELNSPLCAVAVSLETTLAAASDERTRERLERARRAVDRARAIVDKLRPYTRPPASEEISPAHLFEATLTLLSGTLREAEVRVEVEVDLPEPAVLWGSYQHLQQVLMHLLTNASLAVLEQPPERRRLALRCGRSEQVYLEVEDWGCGIPEENRGQIFEPFFSTWGGHAGLGLSVSFAIVEEQGGRWEVHSEPGAGTRMRVYLNSP